MKKSLPHKQGALALALLMMAVLSGTAAQAEQYPAGFLRVFVPAQSDAVVSIPMLRQPVFEGKISAISGNKVTLSGTPTIPAGTACALLLTSGAKEGMFVKITAQSGAILTVGFNAGDNLTGVAAGASGAAVQIIPYWTPASLVKPTAPAGLQILGIDNAGAGINLSFNRTWTHQGGGVWKDGAGASVSSAVLPFNSAFVLRNTSEAQLTVTMTGNVPTRRSRVNLGTVASNTPQDILVGYGSPVPETLANVGLGSMSNGDQILGFNNAAPGYNKSASDLLIMDGGAWKDQVTGQAVGSTFKLKPGHGYIYRKAATSTPTQSVWTGLPVYLTAQP